MFKSWHAFSNLLFFSLWHSSSVFNVTVMETYLLDFKQKYTFDYRIIKKKFQCWFIIWFWYFFPGYVTQRDRTNPSPSASQQCNIWAIPQCTSCDGRRLCCVPLGLFQINLHELCLVCSVHKHFLKSCNFAASLIFFHGLVIFVIIMWTRDILKYWKCYAAYGLMSDNLYFYNISYFFLTSQVIRWIQ